MAKHLLEIQAKTRLSLGKSIAQFLGHQDEPDYTILKWLTIDEGDKKTYGVAYHEVVDEGSEDELSIDEFSRLDPENLPFGLINEFGTIEEALAFAAETYGASRQRYVTEGMINEEYASYLQERNSRDS